MTTAKQTGHPFSVAFAICFASWTHAFCGDLHRALELAEDAQVLSKRHGFEFWIGWTEVISAWARGHLDKAYDTEVEKLREGIANWQETRSRLGLSYFLYLQADLLAANGAHEHALRVLDEAKCFCDETREHFWLPELLRLRGEILFARSPENGCESEALFNSAVSIARDNGLVALQFRALTGLTGLQHEMHGSSDAAQHLEKLLPGLRDGGVSSDQDAALQLLETISTGSHAGTDR